MIEPARANPEKVYPRSVLGGWIFLDEKSSQLWFPLGTVTLDLL